MKVNSMIIESLIGISTLIFLMMTQNAHYFIRSRLIRTSPGDLHPIKFSRKRRGHPKIPLIVDIWFLIFDPLYWGLTSKIKETSCIRNKKLANFIRNFVPYTFFFISNSIFDPLSLRFSKIVATWLATVEPQIVNS